MTEPALSKQAVAAVDLLRRTGASTFEIRYSDDQAPIVWMAISGYVTDVHGRPTATGEPNSYEVAASLDPEQAIFRLCEQLIDGGACTHCDRPTGFDTSTDPMPLDRIVCWHQYDPELNTYRRSCEGDTDD